MTPNEVQAINAQASLLMKRGIHLISDPISDPNPRAIAEAIKCFDQARELRTRLPVDTDAMLGYGLAACWLNRAEALIRSGDQARMPEAVSACDEGIAVLRRLPMTRDPRFPRRLAIAYQNRGLALQMELGKGSEDAGKAFVAAVAVLDEESAVAIPDRAFVLAAVWINLAITRAAQNSEAQSKEAAAHALTLVADLEENDAGAAEAGMKARHVICQVLARRLGVLPPGAPDVPEIVHEATDLVDDALNLARRWEQKGVNRFRTIAYDLFRFGGRIYGRFQPQFLEEFVRDNLDPARSSREYVDSREMRSAAEEVIRLGQQRARSHVDTRSVE